MLLIALQSEISINDYWNMTYGEILLSVEAYRETNRLRVREVASFNHSLANLIALSVNRLLDKKAKYPSLKESFPNLFSDLKDKQEIVEDEDVTKARLLQYMESNNRKKR